MFWIIGCACVTSVLTTPCLGINTVRNYYESTLYRVSLSMLASTVINDSIPCFCNVVINKEYSAPCVCMCVCVCACVCVRECVRVGVWVWVHGK